jgi:hypothetical protein
MLSPGAGALIEALKASGADLVCQRIGQWELVQLDDGVRHGRAKHYVAMQKVGMHWELTVFDHDQWGGGRHLGAYDGFSKAALRALSEWVKQDASRRLLGIL